MKVSRMRTHDPFATDASGRFMELSFNAAPVICSIGVSVVSDATKSG